MLAQNLPTSDATGITGMAAAAGKVALVNSSSALSGAWPTDATIVDLVGFGNSANCFRGVGPTAAPSKATGILRKDNGCTETSNNAGDFAAGPPNPRNRNAAISPCAGAVISQMLLSHYPKLWYQLLALVLDLPPTPISTARIGRPTVAQYSTSEPRSGSDRVQVARPFERILTGDFTSLE